MKKVLSIVLALALVVGCVGFIPNTGLASAETASEEWELLGDNSGLSWQTCSDELESQTVSFGSTVSTQKLRLYVTETFGESYTLREIEILDKAGNNIASDSLWSSNVTLTTNLSGVDTNQLPNLCNGNGGQNGFSSSGDVNWDKFEGKASDTGYIELTLQKVQEIAAVRIWCNYCNDPSWGHGPKSWKVSGLKTADPNEGFVFLGNNADCHWADTASADFEYQEIVLETPMWLSKLRLKVTGAYGGQYKIAEFEVIDNETDHNVLVPIEENKLCTATVSLSDGMKEDGINCLTDGEMQPYDSWRYISTPSQDAYVEYTFDRPYQVKSVKLWCDWCYNASPTWGNAPKDWEVYGYQVHTPIEDTLDDLSAWSNSEDFSAQDGKAVPVASGEAAMYTGNYTMNHYRAEAALSLISGAMGITTHYTDSNSFYRAVIDKAQNTVALYKGETRLAEKSWPIGASSLLAITVNEGNISVWLDEIKMIDYVDAEPLENGKYGVYAKDADGYFDSVASYPISVADYLIDDDPFDPAPEILQTTPNKGDFYVSEDGNDANDGKSVTTPFKTIEKAQSAVREAKSKNPDKDYTVIIRGGYYSLNSTINMSAEDGGTGKYRVTYAAYPGETPIISGGEKITGLWTKQEDGIWVTTLDDSFKGVDVRQLFVNNDRATRSREPDIGDKDTNADGFWPIKDADKTERTWVEPAGTIPEEWKSITGIEMNNRVVWQYVRQPVKTFDTENNRVYGYATVGVVGSGGQSLANKEDWVFFENALAFVDTPGEWFYDKDNNKLYYYPEEGQDPNNLEMIVPRLNKLVSVVGTADNRVQNLDFIGLSFRHTTSYMPEGGFHNIQAGNGCIGYGDSWGDRSEFKASLSFGAFNGEMITGCRIQDCEFTMLGDGGICLGQGTNSSLIANCIITDVGSFGIFLDNKATTDTTPYWSGCETPKGNVIINNYLNYCGQEELATVALLVPVSNHTTIRNNTIRNVPYSGISVGWKWSVGLYPSHHNSILSNDIQSAMQSFSDGAGIYVLGEQYHNHIEDNFIKDTGGVNLYFDQSTRYTYASGNYLSFYQVYYNWCFDHELKGVTEKNNYVGAQPDDMSIYGRPKGQSGDANGDGVVDVRDLVRLKRYRANETIWMDKVVTDFNEDGKLKQSDVLALRELLVAPKVVAETNHTAKTDFTAPTNDYLTPSNLVSTSASVDRSVLERLCDNNYSAAYDSGSSFTLPEEFVFKFDAPIEHETTLRLAANYASKQGPSKVEIYVQQGGDAWEQVRNSNLIWADIDGNQCVEIPLKVTGITGLKVVVTQANLTWSHYIISEMDLF